MNKRLFSIFLMVLLISGCGALATHDSTGPVSHHAQRKYNEAVKKGEVPAEKGQEEKKEQK